MFADDGTMSANKLGAVARNRRRDLVAILVGTAGFVLAAAWVVFDPESAGASDPIPYQIGFAARLVAAIGLMTGITGLHRAHAAWAGPLGTFAYATSIASLVLFAIAFSAFWVLGWLLFHVSALAFGVAVVRGRVLDRRAGSLLIAGSTLGFGAGIAIDRFVYAAEGGWFAFTGTGIVLVGFICLAASETRRSAAAARRLAER
jgi:hypothetical protein